MARRKRRRHSLTAAAVMLLAGRLLTKRIGRRGAVATPSWRRIARNLALERIGYFSPTFIALRLGTRLVRRMRHTHA